MKRTPALKGEDLFEALGLDQHDVKQELAEALIRRMAEDLPSTMEELTAKIDEGITVTDVINDVLERAEDDNMRFAYIFFMHKALPLSKNMVMLTYTKLAVENIISGDEVPITPDRIVKHYQAGILEHALTLKNPIEDALIDAGDEKGFDDLHKLIKKARKFNEDN